MSHLSSGEVLALLLEEFPDVTISKIRFLESQGLIDPERTPSGYRKFYDDDVQLLRVILAEQRQNYLPLRVIKDRLEAGEISEPPFELAGGLVPCRADVPESGEVLLRHLPVAEKGIERRGQHPRECRRRRTDEREHLTTLG